MKDKQKLLRRLRKERAHLKQRLDWLWHLRENTPNHILATKLLDDVFQRDLRRHEEIEDRIARLHKQQIST
jgi:hypothetical protein